MQRVLKREPSEEPEQRQRVLKREPSKEAEQKIVERGARTRAEGPDLDAERVLRSASTTRKLCCSQCHLAFFHSSVPGTLVAM